MSAKPPYKSKAEKPKSGGNKYGWWEEDTNLVTINVSDNPDPDSAWKKGPGKKSAESASHPSLEPPEGGRITRSLSSAAAHAPKDSRSSVNPPSKGMIQHDPAKRKSDEPQGLQPPKRSKGGSISSAVTSSKNATGSGTRKFTPTESKISEETPDEDVAPQEKANPKSAKNKHASTKSSTSKTQDPPNNKETPKQPSINSRPEPSLGNSLLHKMKIDDQTQDSSPQRPITMNPNPKPNRLTSDKTTSDARKMPPPPTPNKTEPKPQTPTKPTSQQAQPPQSSQ